MVVEPLIIVDGYNLMHQILAPRVFGGPGGLERARGAVIRRVCQLVPEQEQRLTTIVFDSGAGDSPTGWTDAAGPGGLITVVFATEYPDADSMILEMIRRHSSPARLTVVSSDRRLIDAARRRGASGTDCQKWMDRQEVRAKKSPPDSQSGDSDDPESGQIVDSDERRFWMKEFGFDPPE